MSVSSSKLCNGIETRMHTTRLRIDRGVGVVGGGCQGGGGGGWEVNDFPAWDGGGGGVDTGGCGGRSMTFPSWGWWKVDVLGEVVLSRGGGCPRGKVFLSSGGGGCPGGGG